MPAFSSFEAMTVSDASTFVLQQIKVQRSVVSPLNKGEKYINGEAGESGKCKGGGR
ncbi:MAG: hypothetical protein ACI965_000330 [Paraglaciecola sp.]|jgi:hypothetical protein